MFPHKERHFDLNWDSLSKNNRDKWDQKLRKKQLHCVCVSQRGQEDARKNLKNCSMSLSLFYLQILGTSKET